MIYQKTLIDVVTNEMTSILMVADEETEKSNPVAVHDGEEAVALMRQAVGQIGERYKAIGCVFSINHAFNICHELARRIPDSSFYYEQLRDMGVFDP